MKASSLSPQAVSVEGAASFEKGGKCGLSALKFYPLHPRRSGGRSLRASSTLWSPSSWMKIDLGVSEDAPGRGSTLCVYLCHTCVTCPQSHPSSSQGC